MPHELNRNYFVNFVKCSVALLVVLAAVSVMAQTARPQQGPDQHIVASSPQEIGSAWQERQFAAVGTNNVRASSGRQNTNRQHTSARGAAPQDGDPMFLAGVAYNSGGDGAVSVAIGDVNGDGIPDLVVANSSNTVGVLLGKGDGTFAPAVTYDSGGVNPYAVAIADVNGDGKADLVVGNCTNAGQVCSVNGTTTGNGVVAVLLGHGDGTFGPPTTYNSGGWDDESVVVADVNGDGKPDIVVGNMCVSSGCENEIGTVIAGVLLNNGDGTFQNVLTQTFNGAYGAAVAVADVNGDGKPDLIMTLCTAQANCPGGFTVSLGNGDGTFQPGVAYGSGGNNPLGIAVGDLNGDGHLDLIVPNWGAKQFAIFLGIGDGTFPRNIVAYGTTGMPWAVAVADVNSDGKLDVLVAENHPDAAAVFLGNGDGTLQPELTFSPGGSVPQSIAVADLNGDGRPDLVVANLYQSGLSGPGTIGVLLNNLGPHSSTATTLASSPNPSVFGQAITLTSQVTSSGGTPTGTVVFFDGSTAIGSATLASGWATITVSSLAAGSHSLTAAYQESLKFSASTSAPVDQVVNIATTTTSLTSSRNPAGVYGVVKYTATIISQYGGSVAGTVTFRDGGTVVAVVKVTGNVANYRTSYQSAGAHSMTATYSGDASNGGSASGVLAEVIDIPTNTSLTTSQSPTHVGQSVTFTATVTSKYGAIPDGEVVTFYEGSTWEQMKEIGTGTTTGGVATFTTSFLIPGGRTIFAVYAGDGVFATSKGRVTQRVLKYPTTTTVVSSLNPSTYGQAVTFTMTVSSAGPTPTGFVTLYDGNQILASPGLNNGDAAYTTSTLHVGGHTIYAVYWDDDYNRISKSPYLKQVVEK